jgi:hypothetical protein
MNSPPESLELTMAAAGTLLSDLDGGGGGGDGQDGDLVQKILADMNVPSGGGDPGRRPIPPPMPTPTPQHYQQMPASHQPMTMDRQIPTSHMIGNEHPTPADFAAAMVGIGGQRADIAAMAAPVGPMHGTPIPGTVYEPPSKNLYGRIVEELKVPFVVALLFFVFSLPPIRVLVGHYMPRLLQPTGEFHITGLLLASAIVGGTFWLLQRVIAPLLSL